MAVFVRAVGLKRAATGKPKRLGGLPHELGSTGFGVAVATKIALNQLNLSATEVRIAIEGYGNVGVFAARFLHETGVNIAVTPEAENILHRRNVLVIPDIIANAGGVISSYAEDRGLNETMMFKLIEEKVSRGVRVILTEVKKKKGLTPRQAALIIARRKLI